MSVKIHICKGHNHQFGLTRKRYLKDKKGSYDIWKCQNCGLKGKRYWMSFKIVLSKDTKKKLLTKCKPIVKFKRTK